MPFTLPSISTKSGDRLDSYLPYSLQQGWSYDSALLEYIALKCGKCVGGIYMCKTLMAKASVIVPGVHDKDWVQP